MFPTRETNAEPFLNTTSSLPDSTKANIFTLAPGAPLGWHDNIIVAMASIGSLTVVVSAIRVAGRKKLKALVGRYPPFSIMPACNLFLSVSESC
jgi:hypothetical protein